MLPSAAVSVRQIWRRRARRFSQRYKVPRKGSAARSWILPCLLAVVGMALVLLSEVPRRALAEGMGRAMDGSARPNILFIILDDVGIDQLRDFNPLAPDPPFAPNLHAVTTAGVKFTNHWTMPECSPSRTCFFTGRWPLRTGVCAAV